jgi:hypothetical protein
VAYHSLHGSNSPEINHPESCTARAQYDSWICGGAPNLTQHPLSISWRGSLRTLHFSTQASISINPESLKVHPDSGASAFRKNRVRIRRPLLLASLVLLGRGLPCPLSDPFRAVVQLRTRQSADVWCFR